MSHELRTPLNGLLGYTQLLHMEGGLSATQSQRVDAILGAGSHLLQMIDQILELSEVEADHAEAHMYETGSASRGAGLPGPLQRTRCPVSRNRYRYRANPDAWRSPGTLETNVGNGGMSSLTDGCARLPASAGIGVLEVELAGEMLYPSADLAVQGGGLGRRHPDPVSRWRRSRPRQALAPGRSAVRGSAPSVRAAATPPLEQGLPSGDRDDGHEGRLDVGKSPAGLRAIIVAEARAVVQGKGRCSPPAAATTR